MAVRQALSSLLERTVTEVKTALHDDETQAVVASLEARLDRLETAMADRLDGLEARCAALEELDAKLEKRLSMAMGAIQAATTQLLQLKDAVGQAQNQSQQAMQRATSALSTAETAADGVGAIEAQLADRQSA